MSAKETRVVLLDAAETIISRDGVASLTLEAVAQEAGVSKGGLLYHFSGKRALIAGLLSHQMETFQERLDAELEREPDAPGRRLRAFIRASAQTQPNPNYSAGLIASIATDPTLLDLVRRKRETWREWTHDDGIDPTTATLVHLSLDGWRLWRTFQLVPDSSHLPESVVERLLDLTRIAE
jgi:AcrR family transcriptional regulator